MYLLIKMKTLIRSLRFWLPVLFGIVFGLCFHFIANSSSRRIQYDIALIDEDCTEESRNLMEEIKGIKGVNLKSVYYDKQADQLISEGDYYLVYTIKKGYMKKLRSAKMKDLIDVESFSLNTSVKWLNDKVAAIIIRDYVYYEMFLRINKEREYSFSEYEKEVQKTRSQSEILRLKVISRESDFYREKETDSIRRNKYAVFLSLVGIGTYTALNAFATLCEMRQNTLSFRLQKVGIKEGQLFLSELLSIAITLLAVMAGFLLTVGGIASVLYGLSFLITGIGSMAFWGISKMAKSKESYFVLSWAVLLILMFFSAFLIFLKF